MAELISVGLDVGTTSTQMIVSKLAVENRAGAFAVPELAITGRQILYRSPVHFTPLLGENLVNGEKIREIVAEEYEKAGLRRESVDTGAIIITGETSRKENARSVLEALSDFAGEFVVATAGPELESVLAAKGAGAVALSERTGKRVLHMDIGGGTSNLAWIKDGKITATGCLNVGGRLVKQDSQGKVTYVSPALNGLTDLKIGDFAGEELKNISKKLVNALEMAAGLREPTPLLEQLWTKEAAQTHMSLRDQSADWSWQSPEVLDIHRRLPRRFAPRDDRGWVISFSGGVADCIETVHPPLKFGDMGPVLGQAIRNSRLCAGEYVLGAETIRATVIGAGCHSAQLSGSTVYHRNVDFPLKNLPVYLLGDPMTEKIGVLILGEYPQNYGEITKLAERILANYPKGPLCLAMEQDMAKALGQALALRMEPSRPLLCLDRLRLEPGSYLDVNAPVGPALPVVIKTLVLADGGHGK
ncbi:MAG: ethanolamine ammonia-lyase reactivating factor EutA [Oscillospiraceae bacterium]|nr:ethanolamine ammonia-lyase reactivating factor EutA [Oscillospiraceae bacterium]